MYQVFGDKTYSSNDIIIELKENYDITTITDLTKSTARDDAIALKCCIDIEKLDYIFDMNNLEEFEKAMISCEKYVENIINKINIQYSISKVRAYRYDEINKNIIFIFCTMYIEGARKKLNDVFKRLLKNNY